MLERRKRKSFLVRWDQDPDGGQKANSDIRAGARELMDKWFLRAHTGQKSSKREVSTTAAPSCFVVFVHGMRKLEEEEPPGRSLK
jgi:hypothetical protein